MMSGDQQIKGASVRGKQGGEGKAGHLNLVVSSPDGSGVGFKVLVHTVFLCACGIEI